MHPTKMLIINKVTNWRKGVCNYLIQYVLLALISVIGLPGTAADRTTTLPLPPSNGTLLQSPISDINFDELNSMVTKLLSHTESSERGRRDTGTSVSTNCGCFLTPEIIDKLHAVLSAIDDQPSTEPEDDHSTTDRRKRDLSSNHYLSEEEIRKVRQFLVLYESGQLQCIQNKYVAKGDASIPHPNTTSPPPRNVISNTPSPAIEMATQLYNAVSSLALMELVTWNSSTQESPLTTELPLYTSSPIPQDDAKMYESSNPESEENATTAVPTETSLSITTIVVQDIENLATSASSQPLQINPDTNSEETLVATAGPSAISIQPVTSLEPTSYSQDPMSATEKPPFLPSQTIPEDIQRMGKNAEDDDDDDNHHDVITPYPPDMYETTTYSEIPHPIHRPSDANTSILESPLPDEEDSSNDLNFSNLISKEQSLYSLGNVSKSDFSHSAGDDQPSNTTSPDPQPPYVWKRVCFQSIHSMQNSPSELMLPVAEAADIYLYYYIPLEEKSHNLHWPHIQSDQHLGVSLKHKYTPGHEETSYDAKSLSHHKEISGRRHEAPKPPVYCSFIPVLLNTTGSLLDESRPRSKDGFDMATAPPPTSNKFVYKMSKMPFNLYDKMTCDDSNTVQCADASACIPADKRCDGIVHCRDCSDEQSCTCRERMDVAKLCDGYADCPNGEDEHGCFGCPANTFSCEDWNKWHPNSNCVSMSQRCDGKVDCPRGKDEENCETLTEFVDSHEIFLSSFTSGYLHRNYRGKWYPACELEDHEWAHKACRSVISIEISHPQIDLQPFRNPYNGQFIKRAAHGGVQLLDECIRKNHSVHVTCPLLSCGSRIVNNDLFIPSYRSRRHTTHTGGRSKRGAKRDDKKVEMLSKALRHIFARFDKDKADFQRRIVGGNFSSPGNWPWLVGIYKNGNFHCGGVILDETWILTAAHCLHGYERYYFEVQAGTLRRYSFSPSEQTKHVIGVITHPAYTKADMKNDIALLRLESPLKYNRWIRPICLPEARPPWGPLPGTMCTAVGWGSTSEHGSNPDSVKEVKLPILPHCKHLSDREGDEICAGYFGGGADTCQGDSGGPLLCKVPFSVDQWYVAGIVSHGEGCARPNEPGAYTRVALYLSWLVKYADDHITQGSARRPRHECPGLRCSHGGRCIPAKQICDGVVDCLNAEDEGNCVFPNAHLPGSIGQQGFFGFPEHQAIARGVSPRNAISTTPSNAINKNVFRAENNDYESHSFHCKIMQQAIPNSFHCDGDVDCEDGTDEVDCKCKDLLKASNETSLICDGVIHCHDLSDENKCSGEMCSDNQYNCYNSHSCINRTLLCDDHKDCPHGEDELNCYAIVPYSSQGLKLQLNLFGVAAFAEQGIVAKNEKGVWKPMCVQMNDLENQRIYSKIAHRLGFKKTQCCTEMMALNTDLLRPSFNATPCIGIKANFLYSAFIDDDTILPSHVDIYINGELKCFGVLGDDQWLLVEHTCCKKYNQTQDYMEAVFGDGKYNVRSPYEQIISVEYVACSEDSEIMAARLSEAPRITKHTRVLKIPTWLPSQNENDLCVMILHSVNSTYSVSVKSQVNSCPRKKRCYALDNKGQACQESNGVLRLGGVACMNKLNEWYLSTTIEGENSQFCSSESNILQLNSPENSTQIFAHYNNATLPQTDRTKPECKYYPEENDTQNLNINSDRSQTQVTSRLCFNNAALQRTLLDGRTQPVKGDCRHHEFKCGNGNCVSKTLICDGDKNCEDGSDEPEDCANFTCATYLSITNPHKLCDLQHDCFDKSDEHPSVCPPKCDSDLFFNCSESDGCIPMDFVCDGEKDCPNGADEKECVRLEETYNENNKNGTLLIRSRGKWELQCITQEFTSLNLPALCQQFGFNDVHTLDLVPGTKATQLYKPFSHIWLNEANDVVIKTYPSTKSTQYEPCNYLHLICKK